VGEKEPVVHVRGNVDPTVGVLEAMRAENVPEILFTSTSTVYGEATTLPTPEEYGPLLPISVYGGAKLACEGLIAAYCGTFDLRAALFRFANVVGPGTTHGVTVDFVRKLRDDPKRLEILGVVIKPITLHIGLGSFRPVDVEDLTKHKMDSENYRIDSDCAIAVNNALDSRKRVCAVGTTSMRTLESSVSAGGRLKANEGWTDKFIFPPYAFKVTDRLVTNFHLPESTLLMLVSAFAGHDFLMRAYKRGIKEGYRYYSYGDAMLIL